jgi:hypothetical protein
MNSEIHRADVIMHDKNCYCDWCIQRRKTPEETIQQLQARVKELEDMNAHLKKCLAIFSDPLLAKIDEEAYVCRECDYKDCKCHLSPEELLQWKKEAQP